MLQCINLKKMACSYTGNFILFQHILMETIFSVKLRYETVKRALQLYLLKAQVLFQHCGGQNWNNNKYFNHKTLHLLHSGDFSAPVCTFFASIFGVNVFNFVSFLVFMRGSNAQATNIVRKVSPATSRKYTLIVLAIKSYIWWHFIQIWKSIFTAFISDRKQDLAAINETLIKV